MAYCGNVCNEMMTSHCGAGGHNCTFMADVIVRKIIIIIEVLRCLVGVSRMDRCVGEESGGASESWYRKGVSE